MRYSRLFWYGLLLSYPLLNGNSAHIRASATILAPIPSAHNCPVTPHVVGYPATGPRGNGDWYANADRTIWATFWGWDFVYRPPLPLAQRPPGYRPGHKVLWVKPKGQLIIVTGRRIDGHAPALVYESADPGRLDEIQPSGVYFPSPGCWQVNARAGVSELRLILLVKPQPPNSSKTPNLDR